MIFANSHNMKILEEETLHEGKYVRFFRRYFIDRKGKKNFWEVFERKIPGHIVCAVPITEKNEIVLEKIFRVPLKKTILDIPVGLVDRQGETEEESVRRELLEETGYDAPSFELLGRFSADAGLQPTELIFFLATGAVKIKEPEPDDVEEIEVVTVPLKELAAYIEKEKITVDIKIAAAVAFLAARGFNVDWPRAL